MAQLQLYITEAEREALREVARAMGIPTSELLRTAVVEWVARCAAYSNEHIMVVENSSTGGPQEVRAKRRPARPPTAAGPATARRAP